MTVEQSIAPLLMRTGQTHQGVVRAPLCPQKYSKKAQLLAKILEDPDTRVRALSVIKAVGFSLADMIPIPQTFRLVFSQRRDRHFGRRLHLVHQRR